MCAGDAEVGQTAQNERFKGEFDTNLVYSLAGTVHLGRQCQAGGGEHQD
jgi:hypothetical protein